MNALDPLVIVSVDELRLGFHLAGVERVLRAVELTIIPDAPLPFSGAIDVAGQIIPVLDLRRRFALPPRELRLGDHLVMVRPRFGLLAVLVDAVHGVVHVPTDIITDDHPFFGKLPHVEGVAKLENGLAVVHDLEGFVLPSEEKRLREALNHGTVS